MKIKHFLPLLLLLGSNEMLTAQEIALTPQPAHLTVKDGRFEFGNQLKAKVAPYQGDSIRMVFESFKKELQEATGIKVSSTQKEAKARIILDLNPQLPAEAYKLNVSKEQVRIEASRPAGFYYALQTLKQLMPRNVMAGPTIHNGVSHLSRLKMLPVSNGEVLCWTKADTSSVKMR